MVLWICQSLSSIIGSSKCFTNWCSGSSVLGHILCVLVLWRQSLFAVNQIKWLLIRRDKYHEVWVLGITTKRERCEANWVIRIENSNSTSLQFSYFIYLYIYYTIVLDVQKRIKLNTEKAEKHTSSNGILSFEFFLYVLRHLKTWRIKANVCDRHLKFMCRTWQIVSYKSDSLQNYVLL